MNLINKILQPFNIKLNRLKALQNEKEAYETRLECLTQFYLDLSDGSEELNNRITGIVFSKNRAMQLHALLASYFSYAQNFAPLIVLYTCSDEEHERSYKILRDEFVNFPVSFISENDFRSQLLEAVSDSDADRIFFMTDDAIFLDHFDLSDCLAFDPRKYIFSLRLGEDFDFCYTHNIRQSVPQFSVTNISNRNFHSWIWKDMKSSPDWVYPLSVDANIFRKKEILLMLDHMQFGSPNSLEAQMQQFAKLYTSRSGVCYPKVKYVNVPCNIVQNEYKNVSTGTFSVDELLVLYLQGQRIDWAKLKGSKAREAQISTFTFKTIVETQ